VGEYPAARNIELFDTADQLRTYTLALSLSEAK
jgi:hypothetical protein